MARFRVLVGDNAGQFFQLDRPKHVVGRHPQCEIVVPSGAVSRNHAQVVRRDGGFFVEDLGSRNGTFLNGDRITEPLPLRDGDEVRICDFRIRFEDETQLAATISSNLTSRISAIFVDEDPSQAQSSITSRLGISSDGRPQLLSASPDVKLQAFVELSTNLAKALSLQAVLPPVLDSLFKIFLQADSGFIVFGKPDGSVEPVYTKIRNEDEDSVRISRGIIQHVLSRCEAVISADASDDSRFSLTESIAQFQIRSFMCAPLVTPEGEILGAIQIDTRDPRRTFSEKDLGIMSAVVSQAAVAIQNAQLHEEALVQRAVQREMELAREVQRSLLPQNRPACDGFHFFDYYEPAHSIGGDYYDYVPLPNDRLAVLVADVSGHGIPAALVMTRLSAEVRFCLATIPEPGQILSRLNQLLCDDGADDRFVTMVLLVIDFARSEMTIANAGHLSPIVRDRQAKLAHHSDAIKGPPLGAVPDHEYRQERVPLAPHESVILVTDGVHEAMNSQGDQFGFERLHAILASSAKSLDELGNRVVQEVCQFLGDTPQSDDICIVAVERAPSAGRLRDTQ